MSKTVYPCCEHGFCSAFDDPIDHHVPCDIPGCPGGKPKNAEQ